MKALISGGKTGQLRWELARTVPAGADAVFLTREEMDVTDADAVAAAVAAHRPDVIINASAYTAVDKAESEREAAFAVNCDGVANLARAARDNNARLVHVSTDFVFDGSSSSPYTTDAPTKPLGVYGESKLAGEQQVQEILGESGLILRTSWVYSSFGNNFVKTMLRLMNERDELGVIADQAGTPTWARGLAGAVWLAAEKQLSGVHHWTDAGLISWYDFAQAIYEEGRAGGKINKQTRIRPLRTEEYPTPARRPAYSVLDKSKTWDALGLTSDHWRESLRKMMQEL
ncbi:dTDP-4-dehydrorhamnose reductase [Granulosicoccaceae sp. 1_MG-2023]|nr:dTDP-4-dehydrorhamnose reductase [Granulosicoccaceae sp. 1_MG-2023]